MSADLFDELMKQAETEKSADLYNIIEAKKDTKEMRLSDFIELEDTNEETIEDIALGTTKIETRLDMDSIAILDRALFEIDSVNPNMPRRSPRNKEVARHSCQSPVDNIDKNIYSMFLRTLQSPATTLDEEDDEEFLQSEDDVQGDITEEYRNDRGVLITDRELCDLYEDEEKLESEMDIPSESNFDSYPGLFRCPFNAGQFIELKSQLQQHFQLLIQNYIISSQVENADVVHHTCIQMLIELESFKRFFLTDNHQINRTVRYDENVTLQNFIAYVTDENYKVDDEEEANFDVAVYKNRNEQVGFRFPSTFFDIRGMKIIEGLIQPILITNPFKFLMTRKFSTEIESLSFVWKAGAAARKVAGEYPLPEFIVRFLALFEGIFEESLKPRLRISKRNGKDVRLVFFESEDNLFYMGLKRYGACNLDIIQKRYLPSKTVKQLNTRLKNLTCRRAADNPIKQYCLEIPRRLTKQQMQELVECVAMMGLDFEKISKLRFPKFPSPILRTSYLMYKSAKGIKRKDKENNESTDEHQLRNKRIKVNQRKWTRDDDKQILNAARFKGPSSKTFLDLSDSLSRPLGEVRGLNLNLTKVESRYKYLISMI
jgi:hypothetical protein